MSEPQKSFFHTFTGIITAITSLIIAITGLYAATDGFNFSAKNAPEKTQATTTEQDHQKQLELLKRQKEIDDLRLAQEKQKLLAEQEIAELKRRNKELQQDQGTTFNDATKSGTNRFETQVANLTGSWSFTNAMGTYTFVLAQSGNEILLQEFDSFGNNVGNGGGTIQGEQVLLNWVEPYLIVTTIEVQAELTINAQGNMLTGNMYTEDSTVPMILYRQ